MHVLTKPWLQSAQEEFFEKKNPCQTPLPHPPNFMILRILFPTETHD